MATTTWTQTAGMVSDEDVDNLESYAEQALASQNAAAESETNAATSETNAATSATNASVSASSAATSAANAATSATNASTSETNASTSATSASTSATAASTSATAAAASETAAAASETAAAASETAAAASETAAASSETAAASSASTASTAATTATTKASEASTSATNAATSETNAATSETNAATSETNAATSETNAATSATNAATSATAAASSASSASTSASAASSAQTAAESARDATLAAYDNFDDRYLGAKSSAPTVDNDGNALVAGALYFDSTAGAMKVYTGSAWVAAYVSGTDYLPFSGGTMTGDVGHGDGVKATFGASADLQVYHDGNNSYVSDQGQGVLYIQGSNNVQIESATGENMAVFLADNAVELYYDNSKKLNTTSSGIYVAGRVEVTGGGSNLFDNLINIRDDTNDTRISFERSDTGSNGWIGIPNWDTDALKIYGPTASGNEPAANYTNGAWSLYGGGSVRLSTTSSGINVTGTMVADGAQIDLSAVRQVNTQMATSGSGYGAITCVEPTASNLRGLELEGQLLRIGTNAYNQTTTIRRLQINDAGEAIFYEDTGADAKMRWLPTTEELRFEDSVKATFGASSDLQIYHDGSNSYISENSTGNLLIQGTHIYLKKGDGSENYIDCVANQGVTLRYDNAAKLATTSTGVSVTGSVELNGWTITESGGSLYFATGGTNKMKLDASGNLDVVGSVNSNATIT